MAKHQPTAEQLPAEPVPKFVVLHTRVGNDYGRGDVVPGEKLGDAGNLARLIDAGAIREADPEESKFERVTFPEVGKPNLTYEATIADLTAQHNVDLERIADLEKRLNEFTARIGTATTVSATEASIEKIAEKDKEIAALRMAAEAGSAQIAELQHQLTAAAQPTGRR